MSLHAPQGTSRISPISMHKKRNNPASCMLAYLSYESLNTITSMSHAWSTWVYALMPMYSNYAGMFRSWIYLIKCQFQAWFIPVDCLYAHVLITSHPLKHFQPTSEDLSGHWVVGTAPASCHCFSGMTSFLLSAATTFPWVGMLRGEAAWVGWY